MLIHTLPSVSGNYWSKILLSQGTTIPTQYVSYSLHKFLTEIKCKIDECVEDWDAYKNTQIHTSIFTAVIIVRVFVNIDQYRAHFLN